MTKYIREKDAAEYLGLSRSTLRNWRHDKVGPGYVKYNNYQVRYSMDELDAYVARSKIAYEYQPDEPNEYIE
jgi:predicted DNA-binding transcriptional regulator AlpA